jgi:hypothetical protein
MGEPPPLGRLSAMSNASILSGTSVVPNMEGGGIDGSHEDFFRIRPYEDDLEGFFDYDTIWTALNG